MRNAKAPEFSLERPLPSALVAIRATLFSPRSFYLNFLAEGSLKEPAVWIPIMGAFVTYALLYVPNRQTL